MCDGDQPGDRPDASDAPDGEKLGPPGVIPLAIKDRCCDLVLLKRNVFQSLI